ncbi:MAG: hypothetical protein HW397_312 [Dehalococcoidia bacterium]|nr:hypothetical protein [Dehalococcoidia bacterium]
MANRLAAETSPYLLQHKDNPVDWFPWGPEALQKAAAEEKPILVSIGYSACHWCHVMEHESFEDPETAVMMNSLFVNIKVDREERPDLDSIYMQAVQALTGRGGWPMTVFLSPDGRPFYGGTYFPPEDRMGMPAFKKVLTAVADAYKSRRGDVLQSADQIVAHMQNTLAGTGPVVDEEGLRGAIRQIQSQFDSEHGGFGAAPKFPQPMTLDFLLRAAARFQDQSALNMVEYTLQSMVWGGIYDQLGGGFHRYSTDDHWLVPHFEKMLYDNALLGQVYLHAYQFTGAPMYGNIVQQVLDYVLREMTSPEGGFYSTQDADSEGEEGKFFVWTRQEIMDALGEREGKAFCAYFGVSEEGNFEGSNILHVPGDLPKVAEAAGMTEEEVVAVVEVGGAKLLGLRELRPHPGRDEKVLTAWNGMMLRTLAEAGTTLGRKDYLDAAVKNAQLLTSRLTSAGRVLRSYKDGQAKLNGYLEDYAMLADGLLALYEATFDKQWLDAARSTTASMNALFWDEEGGIFYDTASDHEALVVRPRDVYDNASPSGGSMATRVLLSMAILTGEQEYRRKALLNLQSVSEFLPRHPMGFGNWLSAADFATSTPHEIAIVGARGDAKTQQLRAVVFGEYLPNKVVVGWDPSSQGAEYVGDIPLMQGRGLVDGAPAAYVCKNYTCELPAKDAATLAEQLGLTSEPRG